jgi:hypothetical protein
LTLFSGASAPRSLKSTGGNMRPKYLWTFYLTIKLAILCVAAAIEPMRGIEWPIIATLVSVPVIAFLESL